MPKPFLTYTQQIEKLENEKGLLIPDKGAALDALHRIGYFSLIGGYKTPFINPMTRVYEANTTIEDIIALYTFDKDLRELTFCYLTEIERHLRQLISYEFCKVHGELQQEYLNPDNYNNTPGNAKGIQKLLSGLSFRANEDNEHSYVVHQRKTYGNVPLWGFKEYKAALTRSLKAFRNRSSRIPAQLLLEYMGFHENWEKITRYKVN